MAPDGRTLRRQQNRQAVLDALVELYREGRFTPSAAEIAERAGLSPRSLFRYFDDTDDLNRAAIESQQRQAAPLVDPGVGAEAPTADKVEALVRARVRVFEAVAPSARAVRVCAHRHPLVAEQLRQSRVFLRRQLATLFPAELGGDEELLCALDVLCAFESYDLLRSHRGLSPAAITATLTSAVEALLSSRGDAS